MKVELLYFDGCPNWTVADERLARALTSITNDWVAEEWLHMGPPVHVEFEPVASHLIPGHRPAALRADDKEARYLINRDDSLDRICASLTATATASGEMSSLKSRSRCSTDGGSASHPKAGL